ncbi:sensor histidine kinase [Peredibacter starrii]|uniref:histidine kinase n=1 Tax=Peredibacter starrii TaxID=28202 RepID=A0AAX4HK11_9BACT|nr:ATP-binding protein [Peredibacter starrii]WPU63562.1 ATP-binding protein [Peredibacter starrii]
MSRFFSIVYVTALVRLKGYKAEEIIGQHFSKFYTFAANQRKHPQYELKIAKEQGRYEEEGWRVKKDGSEFWAQVTITRVTDDKGNHIGFAKVTRDLTERKINEDALVRANKELEIRVEQRTQELRMLMEEILTAQALIAGAQHDREKVMQTICDLITTIARADGALVVMPEGTNLTVKAVSGKITSFLDLKVPITGSLVGSAFKTGKIQRADDVSNDPRVDPTSTQATGVRSAMALPLGYQSKNIGVISVISFKPHAFTAREERILELMAGFLSAAISHADDYHELEEERLLIQNFIATLSHDLRNPLTAAKASAQMMARYGEQPDVRLRTSGRIVDSIDRADRMIKDLLDVSAMRSGQPLAMKFAECDLRAISMAAFEELSSVHGDRFVLDSPDKVIGIWNCDALRRILDNLLTNAVKYGDPIENIYVQIIQSDHHVILHVHNSGKGIPSNMLKTLFEPFRRAENALTSGKKGWGLGLSLVKGIVEAHHGKIEVESSDAKGTTFTIILPNGVSISDDHKSERRNY